MKILSNRKEKKIIKRLFHCLIATFKKYEILQSEKKANHSENIQVFDEDIDFPETTHFVVYLSRTVFLNR